MKMYADRNGFLLELAPVETGAYVGRARKGTGFLPAQE